MSAKQTPFNKVIKDLPDFLFSQIDQDIFNEDGKIDVDKILKSRKKIINYHIIYKYLRWTKNQKKKLQLTSKQIKNIIKKLSKTDQNIFQNLLIKTFIFKLNSLGDQVVSKEKLIKKYENKIEQRFIKYGTNNQEVEVSEEQIQKIIEEANKSEKILHKLKITGGKLVLKIQKNETQNKIPQQTQEQLQLSQLQQQNQIQCQAQNNSKRDSCILNDEGDEAFFSEESNIQSHQENQYNEDDMQKFDSKLQSSTIMQEIQQQSIIKIQDQQYVGPQYIDQQQLQTQQLIKNKPIKKLRKQNQQYELPLNKSDIQKKLKQEPQVQQKLQNNQYSQKKKKKKEDDYTAYIQMSPVNSVKSYSDEEFFRGRNK